MTVTEIFDRSEVGLEHSAMVGLRAPVRLREVGVKRRGCLHRLQDGAAHAHAGVCTGRRQQSAHH